MFNGFSYCDTPLWTLLGNVLHGMAGNACGQTDTAKDGPAILRSIAHVPDETWDGLSKIRVGTACSGTDAPVKALQQAFGDAKVEHVFAIDSWKASEHFIKDRVLHKYWGPNVV